MTPSTPGLTIAPRCQQCGVEIVQTEHGWLHTTTPADGGTDACTHQVRPADAARASRTSIPLPTAATQVDHWQIDRLTGETGTHFVRGTQRGDIGAEVAIVGAQTGDGTVTQRLIVVRHGDDVIAFNNAAAALETARNLLAAAGELAQLQQLG
jgi:hypothetical protein